MKAKFLPLMILVVAVSGLSSLATFLFFIARKPVTMAEGNSPLKCSSPVEIPPQIPGLNEGAMKIAVSDLDAITRSPIPPQKEAFDPLDKPGVWVAALNSASRSRVHESTKAFKWWQGGPATDQADLDYGMYQYGQDAADDDDLAKGVMRAYQQYREERGEIPFQYLQIAQQRAEKARVQKLRVFMTLLFSGHQSFINAFSEDNRPAIAKAINEAPDPNAKRMKDANATAVMVFMDRSTDEVRATWPALKNRYAREAFNWQGQGEIADEEFYNRMGTVLLSIGSDAEFVGLHRPLRYQSPKKVIDTSGATAPLDTARQKSGISR